MKFGVRRTVLIGPASRVTLLSIVALSLFLGGPSPCAFGDQVIAAHGPYAEVARRLKLWISSEMETKGLLSFPSLSSTTIRIVWARGFGFADLERRVPATAETVYRVGSISKLFTEMAVMQLVDRGKLDLDAPVNRDLPEFSPRSYPDYPGGTAP